MFTLGFMLLVLMGHFLGDFFLQSDWMALNKKIKKKNLEGTLIPLMVHCLIYTATIYLCIIYFLLPLEWFFHPLTFIVIFASHVILDGTYIIDHWFYLMKGRSWRLAEEKGLITNEYNPLSSIYFSYTALVQVAADNAAHFIMMFVYFALIF